MRYRELRDYLNKLPDDSVELDQDVTVHMIDWDEFVGVYGGIKRCEDDGTLDEGHIYLEMSSEAIVE